MNETAAEALEKSTVATVALAATVLGGPLAGAVIGALLETLGEEIVRGAYDERLTQIAATRMLTDAAFEKKFGETL